MKTKGRSWALFLIILVVIGFFAYSGTFGLVVGDYEVVSFDKLITKGLDLQGGVSVLEEIVSDGGKVSKEDLESTKDLLSMRVNKMGVAETAVTTEGDNRIRVDIPGKFDSKATIDMLTKTGELTFKDPQGNVLLTGKDIKDCKAYYDDKGAPIIGLEMNEEGTKKFAEATEKFYGQQIAIYMDQEMLTNPNVAAVIHDGKATISGSKSLDDAKNKASIIQSGALKVTLKTVSVKTIGPTLGSNAIPNSAKAGVVGIGLVFIFMILYYRVPGLFADIALIIFILLVLLTFAYMGVALSLPGIAGFLLTIGMAVDANVLIFERIREELRMGKSVKTSVESGFHRALTSILDSNITTIIASIVLYFMGSGVVKGFAVTLMIGVILSMFTAITVTRSLIKLGIGMGILSKPSMFGVKKREV